MASEMSSSPPRIQVHLFDPPLSLASDSGAGEEAEVFPGAESAAFDFSISTTLFLSPVLARPGASALRSVGCGREVETVGEAGGEVVDEVEEAPAGVEVEFLGESGMVGFLVHGPLRPSETG
jgi:hypothetical protein